MNTIQNIDKENNNNWNLRYEKPSEIIEKSKNIVLKCEEISYKKGKIYANLNIFACHFLLSIHNESIIHNLYEIINYFEQIEPEIGYVNALNVTANVLHSYGDYKKALDVCLKSQKKIIKLGYKEVLADNYSIIGLIYTDLSDFEKAINNYKCALKIRTEIDNKKAMASSLNLIARTYSLSGNYSEALEYYNKALILRKEMNDITGMPWTYIGLASTYEKMNDYETALLNYEQALELNKNFNDKRLNLHCYMGIGIVKSIISPSKIAEEYLIKAKKIADDLNSKPVLYNIYLKLSELYERLMDLPMAFAYFKLYQQNKEEVINSKLQNQLKNQEILFAVEKSEKEAEIFRLKNVELKNAYEQLEKQNQEIKDSIKYAQNIQIALLPSGDYVNEILPERFIFYKPRNIVSGDFYWLNKVDDFLIIAVADCTGHGVPGAFVSMLGISFLNEIVNKNKIIRPDLILNELRNMVISALNKNNKNVNDGMDISLVVVNKTNMKAQYAGAFNPLLITRKNNITGDCEIIQIDGDRMPIGLYIKDHEPFLNKEFQFLKDDILYMFTDGYSDQFGGPLEEKQKFMKKRFKQLLIEINSFSMQQQKSALEKKHLDWKGDYEQTDDITVIGIKF